MAGSEMKHGYFCSMNGYLSIPGGILARTELCVKCEVPVTQTLDPSKNQPWTPPKSAKRNCFVVRSDLN
eukprot:scaffold6987_cov72-Cyclotella_meneghiniana.AAC.7